MNTPPRPRVLLVEDDALVRLTLARSFHAAGFDVIDADSLQAGARRAREERPDVAVLDMLLPDGRGVQLALVLQSELRLPFVFLSAYGFQDMRDEAKWNGASQYLTKPVPVSQVVAAARAAMLASVEIVAAH
jgi:two-component system KDP operon response regulator KdpE